MKTKNKSFEERLNEVIDGYNTLILDEIKYATEGARKYPHTSTEEIVRFGQERAKVILLMKDEVIAKILK